MNLYFIFLFFDDKEYKYICIHMYTYMYANLHRGL